VEVRGGRDQKAIGRGSGLRRLPSAETRMSASVGRPRRGGSFFSPLCWSAALRPRRAFTEFGGLWRFPIASVVSCLESLSLHDVLSLRAERPKVAASLKAGPWSIILRPALFPAAGSDPWDASIRSWRAVVAGESL